MKFQIIFEGDIEQEIERTRVAERASTLLNTELSVIKLFSGETVVLKTDLNLNDAQDWIEVLRRKAGMHCKIEPLADTLEWSLEPVEETVKMFQCPACGHTEEYAGELDDEETHACSECGIIGSKYKQQMEKEQEKLRFQMLAAREEEEKRRQAELAEQEAQQAQEEEETEPVRKDVEPEQEEEVAEVIVIRKNSRKETFIAVASVLGLVVALGAGGYFILRFAGHSGDQADVEQKLQAQVQNAQNTPEPVKKPKPVSSRPKVEVERIDADKVLGRAAAEPALKGQKKDVERRSARADEKLGNARPVVVKKTAAGKQQEVPKNHSMARDMEDGAENKNNSGMAKRSYAAAGKKTAAEKPFSKADEMANGIADEVESIRVQAQIAADKGRASFNAQAINDLNALRMQALRISAADKRLQALTYVARAMADLGQKAQSATLYTEILSNTDQAQLEERTKDRIRRLVALQQLSAGDVDAALGTVQMVRSIQVKDRLIVELANSEQVHTLFDATWLDRLLASISEPQYRIEALANLARNRQTHGEVADAKVLFGKALAAVREVGDDLEKAKLSSYIARQMVLSGAQKKGAELFRQLAQSVQTGAAGRSPDPFYEILSKDMADAGLFGQSTALADKIQDPAKRASASQYALDLKARAASSQPRLGSASAR